MLQSALSYALSNTNYGVTNMNNLYNFLLIVMDILTDEQKTQFIDSMILQLGRSFYKNFRVYTITKVPNSPHLNFMRI